MASTSRHTEGSFIAVWAGENPVVHAALLDRLDAAGIRYIDQPITEDPAIAGPDLLPIAPKPRFGFEIAVLTKDVTDAKAVIDPVLELDLQPLAELPLEEDSSAPRAEDERSELPRAPEIAGVIWSGADPRRARFIADALRENEIAVRAAAARRQFHLVVPREDVARAREIVREVTQGKPPE